uniref:Uncharacterized protein n=1 Tax=Anopheles coluzzii TaxID=1518534 RepID=A0A8W7Q235_ANOCL
MSRALGIDRVTLVQRPFREPERPRQRYHARRRVDRELLRLVQDAVVDLAVQPQVGILGHHVQDAFVQRRILRYRDRILGRVEQWAQIVRIQHPHIDRRVRLERGATFPFPARPGRLHLQPVAVTLLAIQHNVVGAQADRKKHKIADRALFRLEEAVLIARHYLVPHLQIGRHVQAHARLVRRLHRVRLDDAVLRYRHIVHRVGKVKAVRWWLRRPARCRTLMADRFGRNVIASSAYGTTTNNSIKESAAAAAAAGDVGSGVA